MNTQSGRGLWLRVTLILLVACLLNGCGSREIKYLPGDFRIHHLQDGLWVLAKEEPPPQEGYLLSPNLMAEVYPAIIALQERQANLKEIGP